jgi:hypothetical protein
LSFSFSVSANAITFDPSYNFLSLSANFIQGRDIALDYTLEQREYRATTARGTVVTDFITDDLTGTGLSIVTVGAKSFLAGTPTTAFAKNVTVDAYFNSISASLTLS